MANTNILLVEDDTALSDAFSTLLRREGFQVDVAFNGREALELISEQLPDLILLDLLMPVMDGKEFLRSFNNKTKIPIIVFSNLDAKDDVNEAMALGASRFMLKSWATPKELMKLISDTLKSSQPAKE